MAKEENDRAVIVEGEITPETVKKVAGIIALIILGWFVFQGYSVWKMGTEIPLQEAVSKIKNDQVKEITVKDGIVIIKDNNNASMYTQTDNKTSFTELLQRDGISISNVKAKIKTSNANVGASILDLASFILMLAIGYGIFSFIRTIQKQSATGGGIMSFGKSNAAVIIGKRPKVTFNDVAGAKEAKEEIKEIVDFLKNPKQFFEMGARIPRGVLLVGEPGTGKTLMARAVAGEAKVPFFHTSGPEFEEMLVGAGASRVRDLFKRAKNLAPSIVFIDEIDAVARRRGMDYKSSNSEQTLNQILVEMDGFENRDAVIIIAATNRPDVLDPAIMRPGRFDRNIRLGLPDVAERMEILQVHSKNKKLAKNTDLKKIAQFTVGYSGADLENVLNEAAILAVRSKRKEITEDDLKEATLKVAMGPRRGSMMMTEEDLQLTAYHEAGHAIVGAYMKDADPVSVITIIPRGDSLGMTVYSSEKDNSHKTRAQLLANITTSTAGRVAEELIFGASEVTTGAGGDIEHATKLANIMVKTIGMSDKVGFVQFDKPGDFDVLSAKIKYSNETADLMDQEVKRIMEEQYKLAETILKRENKLLQAVAKELLQEETINADQFMSLVEKYGTEKAPEKAKPVMSSVSDWIKNKKGNAESPKD